MALHAGQNAGLSAVLPSSHRLPANLRLGRVRLAVSSLERSLPFYCDVLGFVVRESGGKLARLAAPGSASVLIELEEQAGLTPIGPRTRLGLYHFAVLLPDRAALGSFAAHVRNSNVPIGSANHRASESFNLVDPDGLGVEVYADLPRSTWKYRPNGELLMGTEPLNLEDLIHQGRGHRWSGMPVDTTIGHLHFYGDNLHQASNFYHGALGMDETIKSLPGALFFSAAGYHHHVGVNTWAAGSPLASPADPRLLFWELLLPDNATTAALQTSLAQYQAPGDTLHFQDPWGNTLLLTKEQL